MVKIFTISVLVFFATIAQANTVRFDCQTLTPVDKGIVHMSFQLMESRGQVGYVTADNDWPVRVTPFMSQVAELNDNYAVTFERDSHGLDAIRLYGDGCSYITVTLYKQAGYRTGYISMEGDSQCGTLSFTAPISCKITILN